MEFAASPPEALQDDCRSDAYPLSDINMPGMSGLEMLPKLKAARPNVPVIMITAYGEEAAKKEAGELGAAGLADRFSDCCARKLICGCSKPHSPVLMLWNAPLLHASARIGASKVSQSY
jgi:CheY-like chemotaxis protein